MNAAGIHATPSSRESRRLSSGFRRLSQECDRVSHESDLALRNARSLPRRDRRRQQRCGASRSDSCIARFQSTDIFKAPPQLHNADETTPLEVPATPTVTHYQQLAAEFSAALDGIVAVIPKLEPAHVSTVNFVRSHVNVPIEFLATAVAGVEQSAELQAVKKLDVSTARDTLQFIEAFRPIVDRVNAFVKDLCRRTHPTEQVRDGAELPASPPA